MGQDQPQALGQKGGFTPILIPLAWKTTPMPLSDNTVEEARENSWTSVGQGIRKSWTQKSKSWHRAPPPPYKPGTLPGQPQT